jgi:hypothetical protein
MSAGMAAALLGISAGFITLIGLYLWFIGNDTTTAIVMFALAGSQLALVATQRRRGDCSKSAAPGQ